MVKAIQEYRALTTKQLERLFFQSQRRKEGTGSSRQLTRLRYLFHHGFIQRGEQAQLLSEGRKPYVYYLDRRGAELVAHDLDCDVGELDWDPKGYQIGHLYLEHLLATNDVRIAITLAARQHGYVIEKWLDEKTLKSDQMKDVVTLTSPTGKKQRAAVVPDAYFLFQKGPKYHQFLEIDLRTVTGTSSEWGRRNWARKVAVYLEYYRSGKYQERYHTKSMRILTVTTGERRLANLKSITEEVGGKSRFWFTTFEQINTADVMVDPIWDKAGTEGLHSLTWK
jgi:hypothetical protein